MRKAFTIEGCDDDGTASKPGSISLDESICKRDLLVLPSTIKEGELASFEVPTKVISESRSRTLWTRVPGGGVEGAWKMHQQMAGTKVECEYYLK